MKNLNMHYRKVNYSLSFNKIDNLFHNLHIKNMFNKKYGLSPNKKIIGSYIDKKIFRIKLQNEINKDYKSLNSSLHSDTLSQRLKENRIENFNIFKIKKYTENQKEKEERRVKRLKSFLNRNKKKETSSSLSNKSFLNYNILYSMMKKELIKNTINNSKIKNNKNLKQNSLLVNSVITNAKNKNNIIKNSFDGFHINRLLVLKKNVHIRNNNQMRLNSTKINKNKIIFSNKSDYQNLNNNEENYSSSVNNSIPSIHSKFITPLNNYSYNNIRIIKNNQFNCLLKKDISKYLKINVVKIKSSKIKKCQSNKK